jgi:serine protease Do
MDERMIIRHLSAGKANQVEEFPLKHFKEITIGRESVCDVKFDADREDLVSRKHAKITVDRSDPAEFSIADLGSRNGTFINKKRIFTSVKLAPGDLVQFGPGGPEFQFDVEPRPQTAVRPTRFAAEASGSSPVVLPPTREAQSAFSAPPPAASPSTYAPVGKATVERMITQTKTQTRNQMLLFGGLAVIVLCVVGGILIARRGKATVIVTPAAPVNTAMTPTQIAAMATDSVVMFQVGWKLVDVATGRQVFQVYLPNAKRDSHGRVSPLIPGANAYLPVFVALGDHIEPMLTTDDGGGKYQPIGGRHTGSGFLVSSDGFLLTNRHVAAAWHTRYHWNPDDTVGLLLQFDDSFRLKSRAAISAQQFPAWVPINAKFVIEGALDPTNIRIMGQPLGGKNLDGRNDYMDVIFAKTRTHVPAKLARVSDEIDVAMVKIDLPRSLKKLELNDNYDSIKPGDAAIVLGYPAVSPELVTVTGSKDIFNPQSQAELVPDPTVSVGNIGRVIRSSEASSTSPDVESTMGDVYQLTINSTGGGNSGGPVLDDHGRVIAIYTSGRSLAGATVSFAVPIRYGMELMGITKVTK